MGQHWQHWAERYVGLPYVAGQRDCASFVQQVLRERFGCELALPQAHARTARAQSAQIAAEQDRYARLTGTPADGDGVLMRVRGRLAHLGVYADVGGVPHVLHAQQNAGQVCLHRIADLPQHGLTVDGYYRWL